MTRPSVYLDNAATTRLLPEVEAAMQAAPFGNPSSIHAAGRAARKAVEDARERVAALVGADPKEVIFTSGATEANNLAILGAVEPGRHVVTTAVEHPSVLEACAALPGDGIARVPVDADGLVSVRDVEQAITPRAALISVMLVNNEVGAIQPVSEIAALARQRRIPLHVDAAQACGKMVVRLESDLLTLSAHKMHGPKAVGALIARKGVALRPRFFGGGQEFERRPGTENVAGILGFACALELARHDLDARVSLFMRLRDRLRAGLSRMADVRFMGNARTSSPHILNASFRGVDGEAAVIALDAAGICVSSGSACASQSLTPSHVLLAMGLKPDEARSSLRFSFGADSTDEDVDRALAVIPGVIGRLRSISAAR